MSTIHRDSAELIQVEGNTHNIPIPVGYTVPIRKNCEHTDDLLRSVYRNLQSSDALTLGVVSNVDRKATSSTAVNLAVRATDYLLTPTLVVDANPDGARITRRFRCRRPGFADFCSGNEALENCVMPTDMKELSVMGLGKIKSLGACSHPNAFKAIREGFRLTLVELPPLQGPTVFDGVVGELDGVIVVGEYGQKQSDLTSVVHRIRSCGGVVAALVMTGTPSAMPRWLQRLLG